MPGLADILNGVARGRRALQDLERTLRELQRLDRRRQANVVPIRKALTRLEALLQGEELPADLVEATHRWLEAYKGEYDRARQEFSRLFGSQLAELLKRDGLELRGHWPNLKVWLFTVECEEEADQAVIWYGPQQERLARVPLVPDEVAGHVRRQRRALEGRRLNEEQFLNRLYEAWQRVVERNQRNQGNGRPERAPIIEVLFEFWLLSQPRGFRQDPTRENFRGYGRAQFSYDMYRLRTRRMLGHELNLVVATRAFTVRRQLHLWIPDNEHGDGQRYSHLYFREVQ